MAKPETIRAVKLTAPPMTPDEATRTATVVLATEANINGLVLMCREGAVELPTGPLPLLLDHEARVGAVAGRLERFELIAGELRAVAVVADAPASELAWPLVRTGAVGLSIRAEILDSTPGGIGKGETVTRWRAREGSLTPLPADPACVVRSACAKQQPKGDQSMTTETNVAAEASPAPSAAEIRKARQLTREVEKLVGFAPAAAADEIRRAAETEGLEAARAACLDAMAAEQAKAPTLSRGWDPSDEAAASLSRAISARDERRSIWEPRNDGRRADPLAEVIERHWEGKLQAPLAYEFRRLGYKGPTDAEVFRSVLTTTDAPLHWQGMGNRQAMAAFAQAPQGIRAASSVEQLQDYRPKSTLDIGLVGIASEVKEGGETTFRAISESGISYKPTRKSLGVGFSPEAQTNDDLAAIPRVTGEMVGAMLESEARELAALFEGHAQGAPAPDGARLFAPAHNNVVSAALSIASIGDAVTKLRTQTSIGGRFVYQTPGVLLCAPSTETTLRQLLSDQINAAEAANVNPWRSLTLEVDPLLSGAFVYLLADGNRKPLELGRLTPAPVMTSEVEFSTGFYRMKCEHSFGCVVVDHRPVVRLNVAAA